MSKLSVLYVDDDPALLEIASVYLERTGAFSVTTLNSAKIALRELKAHPFDVIISDYQMPEMDGIAFLKALRAGGNTTPFIIFTGRGREEVVIEAINSGADFYLQKGGDPKSQFAELAHKIRHAISQKRADVALKKSEQDYRYLIEHANEAIYVVQDGYLRMVNPQAIELTEYSEQELLNQPFTMFVHPEDRDMLLARFRKRIVGETPLSRYMFRLIRKTGTVRWGELSVVAITWDGHPATLNFLTDVTDRKRAEDALRESEARYREFFKTTRDGVFITTPFGQFIDFNDSLVNALGCKDREEVFGLDVASTYAYPEERDVFLDLVRKDGYINEYPLQFRKQDGTVIDTIITIVPLKNPDGSVKAFIGTVRDITERKRTEDHLQKSEERYRRIFDSIEDLYYQTDMDGLFTILSPSVYRLTGWTPEELVGKPATTLYALPEKRNDLLAEIATQGHVWDYEFLLLDKAGTSIPTSLSANQISNPEGTHVGFSGVIRNISRRKQAEDALRVSEQRYRAVVEDQTEFICRFRPDGTHAFVNEAYCRYFGLNQEEIIGSRFRPAIHPADDEPVRRFFESLTVQNPVDMIEHRIIMPDGSIRWQQWSDRAIFGPDGNITEFQSVGRDVTRHKKVEFALETSEQRKNAIIAAMPDTLVVISRGGIYHDYHSNDERVRSLHDGDIIGTNIRNSKISPEAVEKILQTISLSIDTGTLQKIEYDILHHSGCHHIEARFIRLDRDRVLGIVRDITEHKQAEETIRKSQRSLEEAMDLANQTTWECDIHTGILTFDDRFSTMYGTSADQKCVNQMMAETYIQELVHPDDRSILIEEDEKTRTTTDPHYVAKREYRIIRRDGEVRYIEMCVGITKDAEGQTIRTHGVNQDITERKQAEEALRQSNRKLNLLSSITRHDINNQLTVMMGYLLIFEKMQPAFASNGYLQKIETAAKRISSMIEFTREYEKIGVNAPVWQDICILVEQAGNEISPGNILVKNDLPAGTEILADPLIARVMYNLMDNAVRHGGKITTIRFFVEDHDGSPILVCEDDGDGVPYDEKEKIFERGFGKNTGLGLAISQEILSITGMTIVENGEPGNGARFEIGVPTGKYRVASDNS